jgi:hypothetical protein
MCFLRSTSIDGVLVYGFLLTRKPILALSKVLDSAIG